MSSEEESKDLRVPVSTSMGVSALKKEALPISKSPKPLDGAIKVE